MIDITKENLNNLAKSTGFIKDNLEKVMRLIDILETIFSSKWKNKLVLKGGTAINIFYANMPRLSVDIDLDYTGASREEMVKDKQLIEVYLKESMFQKNYSLSSASKKYFGLDSYVFHFINNVGNRDVLKVEINFLNRTHIFPVNIKTINALNYRGSVEIKVLNEYELYGSKIAALLDRTKPRDIYDVYQMIQIDILNEINVLRKCVLFYNCIGGNADAISFNSDKLNLLSKRDFDRMLKPMLSRNEKFNYITSINEIKEYLKKLLCFSDSEKEFVYAFNDRNYIPEKLFDNTSIVLQIAWHPMAFWKCGKTDPESQKEQQEKMDISLLIEKHNK